MTAGDMDGDGFPEIVSRDFDNAYAMSSSHVFRGQASGRLTRSWTINAPTGARGLSFSSVALGDVNGDGYADLGIAGVEPVVYIFHGRASGAPEYSGVALRDPAQPTAMNNPNNFGYSMSAAGDFNGDGIRDLAISAWTYPGVSPSAQIGRVYVFRGNGMGFDPTPVATLESPSSSHSAFGWHVTAGGDVNGDGYGDLMVGAPRYSFPNSNIGYSSLFLGGPGGLAGSRQLAIDATLGANASMGCAVTMGDLNDDGLSDMVIGSSGVNAAYVIRGDTNLTPGTRISPQSEIITIPRGSPPAYFGDEVRIVGDIDGNGDSELAIGAPGAASGSGAVYLYQGDPMNGWLLTPWSAQVLSGPSGVGGGFGGQQRIAWLDPGPRRARTVPMLVALRSPSASPRASLF